MKLNYFFIPFLIASMITQDGFSIGVRSLFLNDEEIGVIRVSPGYSTLIELDSPPKKIVLGNPEQFQVEFTGSRVAIKPLITQGKANLFILTAYDRYNFTLHIGNPQQVDYVVKVERAKSKLSPKALSISKIEKIMTLKILTIKKEAPNIKIVFTLKSEKDKELELNPAQIALLGNSKPLLLERLYLAKTKMKKDEEIKGYLIIQEKYLKGVKYFGVSIGFKNNDPISFSFDPK